MVSVGYVGWMYYEWGDHILVVSFQPGISCIQGRRWHWIHRLVPRSPWVASRRCAGSSQVYAPPIPHVRTKCVSLPPMLLLYKEPLRGVSVVALRPFVYGFGGTFWWIACCTRVACRSCGGTARQQQPPQCAQDGMHTHIVWTNWVSLHHCRWKTKRDAVPSQDLTNRRITRSMVRQGLAQL